MSIQITILLTARSACAAWGILEIWRYLILDRSLSVSILSQEPATTILKAYDIPVVDVDLPPGSNPDDENSKKILSYVNSFLLSAVPDVVLVGLSTPGEGGVDEAALALAKCPTCMLQDFWGDSNSFFDKHPDCYLVMDHEAKLVTDCKYNTSSVVVGSTRHAKYSKLNFEVMQKEMLEKLDLNLDSIVHGFFCQPLYCLGYLETVEAWADAVNILPYDRIIYRPHPGSSSEWVSSIEAIFKRRGLRYIILGDVDLEKVIVICTSVSSVMSNSSLDVAYVNHFSLKAMAVPIYLLFNKGVVEYLKKFQAVDELPTVKQGVALLVKDLDSLSLVLGKSVSPSHQDFLWRRAKCLPNPSDSVVSVKEELVRLSKEL